MGDTANDTKLGVRCPRLGITDQHGQIPNKKDHLIIIIIHIFV